MFISLEELLDIPDSKIMGIKKNQVIKGIKDCILIDIKKDSPIMFHNDEILTSIKSKALHFLAG